MSEYRTQLEEAVRAIVIHSATSYSWMSDRSPRLPRKVQRALTPVTARAYLRYSLQTQLYHSFYRLGLPAPIDGEQPKRSLEGRTPFVDALSAANHGQGFIDEGWTVRQILDTTVVVEKHGLELWVPVDQCLAPAGTRIAVGESVGLPHPSALPAYSPGFYAVFGDRPFPASSAVPIVRLYWHLTSEGAVPFVQVASELLNRARISFRFKVLSDPERYERCDAAVIYVPADNYQDAAPIIEQIYAHVAPGLRAATPAFTKPLAPGLGLAEDPPGGQSFGMHRCGLVADGLIAAHSEGAAALGERVGHVVDRFAEAGIDIDAPYLNPGSTDVYDNEFLLEAARRPAEAALPNRG
ncbi:MAG: T3SS effector HopA1 family protein [Actinomycetota bacterium]